MKEWHRIWGERARKFFLSFRDPLFIVMDEVILECNPQASRLFNIPVQEMKGKGYYELCPSKEEARRLFQPRFERAVKEGGHRFQTLLHKRNGEEIHAEITIHSISLNDGTPLFLVHLRDITLQKKVERKLKETEETLAELVENAPMGIFRTTPEGKVLYANAKLLEIFGVSKQDLERVDLRNKVYKNPEDRDRFVNLLLEKGRVENFQVQVRKRDGSTLWVSLYARTVKDDEGKVKYFEGAFLDITEEKRLEAQLQEIHRMEAIGTLVGGIAHEFNNILTGIIGYAELASIKLTPDHPVVKDLENIKEGARRAADLVRKLAAFGRKTILRLQAVDLKEIIAQQVALLEDIIPPGIDLRLNLDPRTEPVEADPDAVKEMMTNLFKNALDAMPQGGTLTLEVRPFEVGPQLVKEFPWLEEGLYSALVVQDTGVGIDKKVMPHIFEPFFTTKGVGKGTGLGLSMVYGLVKQHRGAVLVESKPKEGSKFTIILPIYRDGGREERIQPPLPFLQKGHQRTVLLVEDEEPVRKVIKETLEGGGCQVLEASNGKEALEILMDKGDQIDVAILDLILPQVGGKEISHRIREVSPHTRVLFISGYSPESLHPKYRPEEGAIFLHKPFTPQELLNKVGELMK